MNSVSREKKMQEAEAKRRQEEEARMEKRREKVFIQLYTIDWINTSPPSAAYTCQWIGSALVHIMACRLFGAKTLSKPLLRSWQLDI